MPPDPLMGPGQLNDDEYAAHFRVQPVPLMAGCRWCSGMLVLRAGGFFCLGCDTPDVAGTLDPEDPRTPPTPGAP